MIKVIEELIAASERSRENFIESKWNFGKGNTKRYLHIGKKIKKIVYKEEEISAFFCQYCSCFKLKSVEYLKWEKVLFYTFLCILRTHNVHTFTPDFYIFFKWSENILSYVLYSLMLGTIAFNIRLHMMCTESV